MLQQLPPLSFVSSTVPGAHGLGEQARPWPQFLGLLETVLILSLGLVGRPMIPEMRNYILSSVPSALGDWIVTSLIYLHP